MSSDSPSIFTRLKIASGFGLLALLLIGVQGSIRYVGEHGQTQVFVDSQIKKAAETVAGADRRLAAIEARLKAVPGEIAFQEDRHKRADKIVEDLQSLSSLWERTIGNPEQQRVNDERILKVKALSLEASQAVASLQQESRQLGWERDGAEIDRSNTQAELLRLRANYPTLAWYLRQAVTKSWWFIPIALLLAWLICRRMARRTT